MIRKQLKYFYSIIAVLFFYNTSQGAERFDKRDFDQSSGEHLLSAIALPPDDSQLQASAIRYHPLQPTRMQIAFIDEGVEAKRPLSQLDKFANDIDKTVFSPKNSKKSKVLKILGTIAGATVSSSACGYLMYNTAAFLHIPKTHITGVYSGILVSWTTISTTPVFTIILYEASEAIGNLLFEKQKFTSTPMKLDFEPHVIKWNKCHMVVHALACCSALISAGFPTALVYVAEKKNFPVFFYILGSPVYAAWLAAYIHETSWNLDQYFQKYYLENSQLLKKRVLQEKIKDFKLAIQSYESLVTHSFNEIQKALNTEFRGQASDPFAFSCLFLKASDRVGNAVRGNQGFANFTSDVNNLRTLFDQGFLNWLSPFILGLGTYAKFSITHHVLNNALLSFGLDNQSANITSGIMAGFEVPVKLFLMSSLQKKFMTGVPEVCSTSHYTNFKITRKIAGFFSGVNAVLFSLPTVVQGLEVYSESSLIEKAVNLLPPFFQDASFYYQIFNTGINEFLTKFFTMRPHNITSVERQRALLSAYADRASEAVQAFDGETTNMLYNILQGGR